MRITTTNNTNFCSRNQTIRFADDIARQVNKCYPRLSASKIESKSAASKFPDFVKSLIEMTNDGVRYFKDVLYDSSESFYDRIKAFTEPVKKYKLGNCGESAQLAAIAAKINGIKNCHIALLRSMEENSQDKDLDHLVLFVNDKKPYIIDPWLGIADYVPNILSKYKYDYSKEFGIKQNEKATFCSMIDDEYTDFLKDDFSRKQINKLKKNYPELFIKRGYV